MAFGDSCFCVPRSAFSATAHGGIPPARPIVYSCKKTTESQYFREERSKQKPQPVSLFACMSVYMPEEVGFEANLATVAEHLQIS